MYDKTTLNNKELTCLLELFPCRGGNNQAARVLEYLAQSPDRVTVDINQDCAVGNISDCATRKINPRLKKFGLFIGCERPPSPVPNRFDQPSGMYLWSLYRIPENIMDMEAANDD